MEERSETRIPWPDDEKTSVILVSLVFLVLDFLAYAGLVIHTLLSRRRYVPLAGEGGHPPLTPLQEFFLATPGTLYAAGFLLLIVGLIAKEVALERKSIALKINVAALAGAVGLLAAFFWAVQGPFERRLAP